MSGHTGTSTAYIVVMALPSKHVRETRCTGDRKIRGREIGKKKRRTTESEQERRQKQKREEAGRGWAMTLLITGRAGRFHVHCSTPQCRKREADISSSAQERDPKRLLALNEYYQPNYQSCSLRNTCSSSCGYHREQTTQQ